MVEWSGRSHSGSVAARHRRSRRSQSQAPHLELLLLPLLQVHLLGEDPQLGYERRLVLEAELVGEAFVVLLNVLAAAPPRALLQVAVPQPRLEVRTLLLVRLLGLRRGALRLLLLAFAPRLFILPASAPPRQAKMAQAEPCRGCIEAIRGR